MSLPETEVDKFTSLANMHARKQLNLCKNVSVLDIFIARKISLVS